MTHPPGTATLRDVTPAQWRAFLGTFFGWMLDGFDFTILTFILIDIQRSFTINRELAGALGTVTLMTRLIGGLLAGTAADRWGRKGPLMLSILWFSLFAFLSGFSTSYAMLFALRALFGVGMGGEWAAGMPLTLEHWPRRLRGVASGLLQGGFYWGFIVSAVVFEYVYPRLQVHGELAWRSMFWIGIVPALLVFWIRRGVEESPVWLERQRFLRDARQRDRLSLVRIFERDLIATTIQTAGLIAAFMCSYYAITFWYPTFLRQQQLPALWPLVLLNLGAIVGMAAWGRLSELAPGRRGAVTLAALVGLAAVPLFVFPADRPRLLVGAFAMGFGGTGIWGMAPSYLTERFPTEARGVGPGFSYHVGAAVGSVTPLAIGAFQDRGYPLAHAMAACIAAAGVLVIALVWLGPETRGMTLNAVGDRE